MRIAFLFAATIVLDAIASVLVFLFERHAYGTGITSFHRRGNERDPPERPGGPPS